jgi:hypothetical protein
MGSGGGRWQAQGTKPPRWGEGPGVIQEVVDAHGSEWVVWPHLLWLQLAAHREGTIGQDGHRRSLQVPGRGQGEAEVKQVSGLSSTPRQTDSGTAQPPGQTDTRGCSAPKID